MLDRVLIDGSAGSPEALNDRAFQYGDGLFETIAVVDGMPCLWGQHMRRLATGCGRLRLPPPDPAVLLRETLRLAEGTQHAVLKLYWTAGDSPRGYRRSTPLRPRRTLRLMDWNPSHSPRNWRLRCCDHRLSDNPVLAGIKHLNRLDQVLGRAEWSNEQYEEGLMRAQDGRVLCGTMSNVFLQFGDVLVTPHLDSAGVEGVVRALALDLAEEKHGDLRVQAVSLQQVIDADAVYLTNSLVGVARVKSLDEQAYDSAVAEHAVMTAVRERCHRPESLA